VRGVRKYGKCYEEEKKMYVLWYVLSNVKKNKK
jgi:hypothetical protein